MAIGSSFLASLMATKRCSPLSESRTAFVTGSELREQESALHLQRAEFRSITKISVRQASQKRTAAFRNQTSKTTVRQTSP